VLDVGTHVGRFIELARQAGWQAEGAEFNSRTASYAARRTGAPIHEGPAQELAVNGRRFGAVTLGKHFGAGSPSVACRSTSGITRAVHSSRITV
jgi:hypothetical protein